MAHTRFLTSVQMLRIRLRAYVILLHRYILVDSVIKETQLRLHYDDRLIKKLAYKFLVATRNASSDSH